MPFTTMHVFPTIIASYSTNFRCFDALAINDYHTWTVFLPSLSPYLNNKVIINALPRTIIRPFLQVPIDSRRMRILMWDHFPLTARLVLVKEGVDDTT